MARTGRRPGGSGTREAILEAARQRFAEEGYAGASMRAIAAAAGVDAALVHHYFGNKRRLFAATLQLPLEPSVIVAEMLDGDRADVGARLLRTFLGVWDGPDGRARLLAVVRSMLTDEHAARTFREFLLDAVLGPLTRGLDTTDAELRGTLVASQLVGMAVVRYGIRVEPLASADHDTIVAALAPTLQRYITGDLSA